MLLSRILGAVGRIMIASGVLLLMFVAFQLWGTGLRTSAAQGDLKDQFEAQRARLTETVGDNPTLATTTTAAAPTSSAPTTAAPVTTAPATPATDPFPAPKPGEPIGQIRIPKIGVDFSMVEDVDLNYLRDGPGHFPSTPFPGQAGNAALAGHRTTWLAPFNRIDELAPGDTITVDTLQGTFTYEVIPQAGPGGEQIGHHIVGPNATEILDQPPGENLLTLMACHPKFSAEQRIIVVGRLVGNPAATTEKSEESKAAASAPPETNALIGGSGGGLLSNSPEDRMPAILWGLAAGAVWLVAWLIALRWPSWHQWQRWTVFAVAFPFFVVPLFLSFEHINHLLPAGY